MNPLAVENSFGIGINKGGLGGMKTGQPRPDFQRFILE